jgi:hypothetical protein
VNATQLVTEFFQALDRGEWERAAALIDARQAEQFQRRHISHLLAWIQYRERLKGPEPHPSGFGSSGEVDDELLSKHSSVAIPAFRDAPTLGALAALSPEAFFSRHLGEQRMVPVRRNADGQSSPAPRRILGEVPGLQNCTYVLYINECFDDGAWPNGVPNVQVLPVIEGVSGQRIGLNDDLTAAWPASGLLDDIIAQESQ